MQSSYPQLAVFIALTKAAVFGNDHMSEDYIILHTDCKTLD